MAKKATKLAPACAMTSVSTEGRETERGRHTWVRSRKYPRGRIREGPANFHSHTMMHGTRTAKTVSAATTGPLCHEYLTPPHCRARTRQAMQPIMIAEPIQSSAKRRKARAERGGLQRPNVHRLNFLSV